MNDMNSSMKSNPAARLFPRELPEKRTEYGKVFQLDPKHFQAVTYAMPIHERGQNGAWAEIDRSFHAEAAALHSANARMHVQCQAANAHSFVTVQDADGYTLSYGLENAQAVAPVAEDAAAMAEPTIEALRERPLQLDGCVRYAGILPGVDLVCRTQPEGFKDEIVYHTLAQVQPVTFRLYAPELSLALQDNGDLHALDAQGVCRFILPVPFVLDSENELGEAHTTLSRDGEGWLLRCEPDADFCQRAKFPVVLDPAIYTGRYDSNIESTYVDSHSSYKNRNYGSGGTMHVQHAGDSDRLTLLRIRELPSLDASAFITSAKMAVAKYTQPTKDVNIYAREITSDWVEKEVTYTTRPETAEFLETGAAVPKSTSYSRYIFLDITALTRRWYGGEANYGVQIESQRSWPNAVVMESSRGGRKPYFVLEYASLAGLEEDLAYDTLDIGRAGAANISLANGNMILALSDFASGGLRLPASVQHFYNSCDMNQDYFGLGYGWRTSLHQTLHRETRTNADNVSVLYYVYTDADGTQHAFTQENGEYHDLSNLGMTLTLNTDDATAVITTKMHTEYRFTLPVVDWNGSNASEALELLGSVRDPNGSTLAIASSGLRITYVTDGAGRLTAFNYANGRLSTITLPHAAGAAAQQISFAYNAAGQLSCVTQIDGVQSQYGYNADGLLSLVQNADGRSLAIAYRNTGSISGLPHQVLSASLTGGTLTAVSKHYDFQNLLTVVTDTLTDNGKKLFYHFNNDGHVVSINDELGYAVFAQYEGEKINKPTAASGMRRVVNNLLLDHGFEDNSSVWVTGVSRGTGDIVRDETVYHTGLISRRIHVNADSEAYVRQEVAVTPGKSYTFSGYVKTSGDVTALLRLTYTDADGALQNVDSQPIRNQADFDRFSVSLTLPEALSANTMNCQIVATEQAGLAWFDDLQLEEGLTCNAYNMLVNSDFSHGDTPSAPAKWVYGGSADHFSFQTDLPDYLSGRALRFLGRDGYGDSMKQEVRVYGKKGDELVFGGWTRGYFRQPSYDYIYMLRLEFKYTGDSDYTFGGSAQWNAQDNTWQFACGRVQAARDYSYVRFVLMYHDQINHTDYASMFLYREPYGALMGYDSRGNCITRTTSARLTGGSTYDDFNNVLTSFQPGHSAADAASYTWGDTDAEKKRHLPRTVTSPLDTLQEFSYNEHGGVVRSVLRHADAQTPQIVSGTAYQHNGNHILSQTDARGKTVTHDIDENTDLTRAVTDPNGQQVQYAYDSARRVTQVSASAGGKQYKNAYAYENDRLKTVSHNTDGSAANNVTYRFAYDAVGRPTETHVGSRLLSRNVYNADGTLQKVIYGNSSAASAQEVMYGYDDFRRLKDVRFGGDTAPRYEYAYNARGGVAWVRNNRLNTIARSDYDFGGRPRSMVTQDASGANVYTARVDYDTCGRLARFAEQVGASRAAYETTFGYDREDRPTALTYGSSASRTETAYDGLGRLSTRKVYVNGSAYTTAYAYAPGAESGQTTALVQEITQPGENHSYAYDNVGNIVSVARNGVTTTYAYDALGQLIRVNDPNDGTWTYEYDCGGNILNKKQYAYTTGTLGTVQQIVSYAYGDADWKDKLTRYNGVDIAYDAIGNPIQDGVWTYTWENGHQLRRMACDATIAEFVYNADGLRVQKTVNGVATNYTLHGKNIVHMTKGNAELHFWYDAQNRPAIVEFNGTKYGYLYNLQGDVIGLIDSANTEVVKYTYDAWGKPLSVTGSLANTIGYYNPFRYHGYVYDVETGFYYVSSRYYDPEIGRWINADIPETLTADFENFAQYNLFAYCFNDPVNMSDETGTWPSWATKLAIGIAAIVVGAAVVAATAATGGAAAAFVGAAVAGLKTAAVSGAIGAAVGAGTCAVSHRVSTGGWSGAGQAAVDGAVDGFANGFMAGGIMAGGSQILSSGFKVAANAGVPTGRNGGLTIGDGVRVLSPNHPQAYEAGGTLLKIGSKYKNIRFDVGSNSMFHMNIQLAKNANYHLPIGMLGAGLWGGIAYD